MKWDYSDYSEVDLNVKKHFPFDNARKNQLETISEIKKAIDNGYKYIILEAGTGTGKSAIAATLALMYDSTYILTVTKQLQDQYLKDFKNLGFKLVKGRGNFKCRKYLEDNIDKTCDEGRCVIEGYNCEFSLKKNFDKGITKDNTCHYHYQKYQGLISDVVISNYAYLFLELNFVQDFSKRKLMIFDEAHNVEDSIMNQLKLELDRKDLKEYIGVNLSKQTINELDNGDYKVWINFIKKIKSKYLAEYNKIKNIKNRPEIGIKRNYLKKRVKECSIFISFIKRDPDKWIFDYDSHYGIAEFKPVKVDKYSQNTFFKYGDVCIFMSATILDYKLFAEWLGLDESEVYAIRKKSPFEINRNPIKTFKGFNMSYENLSQSAPKTIDVIKEILLKHKNDKGIIHTISYGCKNFLKKNISSDRFIDHKTYNRTQKLKEFEKSKKPLVLISPSMNEGVDLPGDLCRFQIIYKIPYLNVSDKQTSKRMRMDQRWFKYKTCLSLVQTLGRGMRYEDDYCITYFIDSRLKYFVFRDELSDNFLPQTFKNAIDIAPAEIKDSLDYKSLFDKIMNTEPSDFKKLFENVRYEKSEFKTNLEIIADRLIEIKEYERLEALYNSLLDHEAFAHDYYLYYKLAIVYRKNHKYDEEVDIITRFFKSKIPCNSKQLDWFKKRLKQNSKYGAFDYSTITDLEAYYNTNKIADMYSRAFFNGLSDEIKKLPGFISDRELLKHKENEFVEIKENYDKIDLKADLKNQGKDFEKEDYQKAVEFYEDLKRNELFKHDYYPYRRQCILYKNRIKDDWKDWSTIKDIFKNEIYLNKHQYIWLENKIYELTDKLNITNSDINQMKNLVDEFKKNNDTYEDMLPIAERIFKDEEGLKLLSKEKYDYMQDIFYVKELGVGYIRRGEFEKAIKYYTDLLDCDFLYFQYHAYKQIGRIYDSMNDSKAFKKLYEKYINNV